MRTFTLIFCLVLWASLSAAVEAFKLIPPRAVRRVPWGLNRGSRIYRLSEGLRVRSDFVTKQSKPVEKVEDEDDESSEEEENTDNACNCGRCLGCRKRMLGETTEERFGLGFGMPPPRPYFEPYPTVVDEYYNYETYPYEPYGYDPYYSQSPYSPYTSYGGGYPYSNGWYK